MGSNFNATATFSATSILTGPLSESAEMISNSASDTHHESARVDSSSQLTAIKLKRL